MRWGDYDIRFARPIRWLVSLYGDKVIPFSYVDLQAGRTSRGHRTLGGYIRLVNPEEYLEALETAYVIADQDRRKEIISKQIKNLATNIAGQVDEDDDLKLKVMLKAVRVLTVSTVCRPPGRLHICYAPGLGTERPQKGGGIHGASTFLDVIGLKNDTALLAPILV